MLHLLTHLQKKSENVDHDYTVEFANGIYYNCHACYFGLRSLLKELEISKLRAKYGVM